MMRLPEVLHCRCLYDYSHRMPPAVTEHVTRNRVELFVCRGMYGLTSSRKWEDSTESFLMSTVDTLRM